MATIPSIDATTELAYRHLVSGEDWECLVRHLEAKSGLPRLEAEALMNEALGFVSVCAAFPGELLAPSAQVDMGWDLLITHTRVYRELCQRLGVGFIDHDPLDGVGFVSEARGAEVIAHTAARMGAHGPVNTALWDKTNGTGSGGSGDGGDGKGWLCCVGGAR